MEKPSMEYKQQRILEGDIWLGSFFFSRNTSIITPFTIFRNFGGKKMGTIEAPGFGPLIEVGI